MVEKSDEEKLAALVQEALNELSEGDREVIRLLHTEGKTSRQAARELGISVVQFRTRSFRALQALRRTIVKKGGGALLKSVSLDSLSKNKPPPDPS